jgi:hypothetical protein
MGSYRSIITGPPEPLEQLVREVCEHISKKDKVKNAVRYEDITVSEAREIHKLNEFHDSYPYLFHFPWDEIPDYLDSIEQRGYEKITGIGLWLICYHYSPGTVIENNRSQIIQYVIDDGADGSITPFSYDWAQEFVTEL